MMFTITAAIAIVAVVAYYVGKANGEKQTLKDYEYHHIFTYKVHYLPKDKLRAELMKKVEEELVEKDLIKYWEEDGITSAKIELYTWKENQSPQQTT